MANNTAVGIKNMYIVLQWVTPSENPKGKKEIYIKGNQQNIERRKKKNGIEKNKTKSVSFYFIAAPLSWARNTRAYIGKAQSIEYISNSPGKYYRRIRTKEN